MNVIHVCIAESQAFAEADLLLLQLDVVFHICLLFGNLLFVLHQILWHLTKFRLEGPPTARDALLKSVNAVMGFSGCQGFDGVGLSAMLIQTHHSKGSLQECLAGNSKNKAC